MAPPAAAVKENAPSGSLKQTTLQMGGTRKRTLTMSNGEKLDITSKIDKATPEIVEAMRLRILELEDEISTQAPPAKRARTSAAADSSAPTPNASAKADEKKRKIQVKKIFDQLKKDCKSNDVKFQGTAKTIKIDEVLEPADFDAMFAGKGLLVQPTPECKPKSTVTIMRFENQAQIAAFFGDELKPLKGNIWSRGGSGTRNYGGGFGFGGGGGFAKSVKLSACDVAIRNFEVNYARNSLKCTIKFEVTQVGAGANYYDDESDY
ncbi:hypothetical protein HYPSUDRAFT_180336 [Hypholoma sublateritium FD-334 SS-4]|uniref:Uncharacterized protein n=1 Tax=Hypholoma sublateritium (strain FD-334 SS-4) TaxID=945553 RepID=A0A0D2P760_HYPSF|nr:hypothetical protein HYPSUDRAFT_180336 [Hypholoma sublateritium FD-334 SS-4]